ncbi:hypothetical protein Q3C01_17495 [Bradyrhizobium sp. UFLA05-109]
MIIAKHNYRDGLGDVTDELHRRADGSLCTVDHPQGYIVQTDEAGADVFLRLQYSIGLSAIEAARPRDIRTFVEMSGAYTRIRQQLPTLSGAAGSHIVLA